ncbi:murein hydrolase activator EnvC family protein [Microbacterium sp. NPDC090218]
MLAPFRITSGALVGLMLLLAVGVPHGPAAPVDTRDLPRWTWPLSGAHVVAAPFRAPAHAYGAGHRGIDLSSSISAIALAPADGTVAFRGTVVDRPLLTITHDGGFVTTFEPLRSTLDPGEAVSAGQAIGTVDVGGHTTAGALHVGVRRDGVYLNPMLLLFGEMPRAILLPCCGPL